MDRQAFIAELKEVIQGYLKNKNLDLVDLIYRYEGRDLVLRILVDRLEGGISLNECACLNKEISIILDEKDILQKRYILEVSSPGLDRPLRTGKDFLRCINRKVRVFLNEPLNNKLEQEGAIIKASDDLVCLDIGGDIVEIPLTKINKAKQIVNNI